MSADALSNFLKRNIVKIFENDLRDSLEGVTHRLTLNRAELSTLLRGKLSLTKDEADEAITEIEGSLLKHRFIENESSNEGGSVWVASSKKTKLNPRPVANPYKSFYNWKKNLYKNTLKDLSSGSKLKDFGENIHLGHGAAGGVAVVTHRSMKATKKLMSKGAKKAGVNAEAMITEMEAISLEVDRILGKIDLKLKADDAFTARSALKKTYTLNIELQWGKSNLSEGQKEKQIKNAIASFVQTVIDNPGAYLEVGGSPSMLNWVDKALDTAIIGKKKIKDQVKTTKASHSIKSKIKKGKKPLPTTLPRIRDTRGRFTSPAAIQNIIQSQITEKVKENMGQGGSLVNRTGRFAESVTITNVTQTRQGSLTAFYNYMKYPYQTFERGFKQGSTRRDPRLLIHKSIREIAQKLVHRKLNIKSRRV